MKNSSSLFNCEIFFKQAQDDIAQDLIIKTGVTYTIARLLSLKGLDNYLNIDNFLNPSLKSYLPDPFKSLLDMDLAVQRIVKAITKNHKIAIFADYDVDGACCGAMLKLYFKLLNIEALIYIPDRFKEGYGPNTNALLELRKAGYDLVITVDCGTVAFEPLKEATKAGLDIVVVDHHLGVREKPDSIAIINPNRFDETSDLTYLCGGGVVFMLLVALNKTLREMNFFTNHKIQEPDLIEFSSLAALATVCDVVPTLGLNRAIVKTGLRQINKNQKTRQNIGLKKLCEICGLNGEVNQKDLGFALGPRINSGGRLSNSSLGAILLSTDDEDEAYQIASELDNLNQERKKIEENVRIDVEQMIQRNQLFNDPVIFCGSEDFHQGVIGITASRIKDKYNKPVCIMEFKDGIAKASCRSIDGIDIGEIINKANNGGLLIKGGGHGMAGGYSCELEKLEELKNFIFDFITKHYPDFSYKKNIYVDSQVSLSVINNEFYEEIEKLGPFGPKNSEPIFHCSNLSIYNLKVIGENHISMGFQCSITSKKIRGVIFNYQSRADHEKFFSLQNREIDLVFSLKKNTFYTTPSIEVEILDILY